MSSPDLCVMGKGVPVGHKMEVTARELIADDATHV
jgi:hypothetical protein